MDRATSAKTQDKKKKKHGNKAQHQGHAAADDTFQASSN